MSGKNNKMEKLVSLAKRRGYLFQSSEIYGGLNSCWDYGPLGVQLKKNIENYWWDQMVIKRSDIEGLDSSILMHPKVWEASGHVSSFTDPMVDCKKCKMRFKADAIDSDKCPNCGGELTAPRNFNLMFKTHMGPVEDAANVVFLRPETAQGIYVNYLNVINAMRRKVPFGIAQAGKAFRNEITPGNFIFRTREFEQMEMQYFVKPGEDSEWFDYWKEERYRWHLGLGINKDKIKLEAHGEDELAHYAKAAYDVMYEFPFGWNEIEGIHNRTDFDLSRHQEYSKKNLTYFDDRTKERYIPYIIETSIGLDRTLLVVLIDSYDEEEERVVLRLPPRLAPMKAAILPLVKRDGMDVIARNIYDDVRKDYKIFYDEGGSIGRRYRRLDEIGTPFAFTVDSQTLEDETVTIRYRDDMSQERIHSSKIKKVIADKLMKDNL